MNDIVKCLVHDHKRHEISLKDCEIYAGAGDWEDAIQMFYAFVNDLKLHMRMEEEVIYPIFVKEIGDPQKEIADLSDDHNYLMHLMNDLGRVISTRDIDHFEDSLIPLKKAMARHYRHEEAVLQSLEKRTVQAFCEYPAPKLPSTARPFTNNVS